ncbi:Putative transmembrane protein (PGPGW) [Bythopirellula goksoeyrii]|uniref:Transmembrane protein (PGPGW) n=2 Tax=Bythopirellula goksoeyrii TaxID=1400387 RepID=A0A5B9QRL6_9BACT|nr:Putative transmembrane protein (PGPGW) [Bythopirellula goksoeyrii]
MQTHWLDWIDAHQTPLWWLGGISLLVFFGSLILIPVVVARIPSDYFQHVQRPPTEWSAEHPVLRAILLVAKNAGGVLLVLLGLAMLVLPGQGLLCILLGITLLDFPGKFRLERRLISHPPVLHSINWLRRRRNKAPLVVEK